MGNFGNFGLTDYSNTAAAGGAFEGFAKALVDAQDRSMKRQEFQAKMNAAQSQMEREQSQTAIEKKKANIQAAAAGLDPETLQFDPNSPKARHDIAMAKMASDRMGAMNDRVERMRQSRETNQANQAWGRQFGSSSPNTMRLEGAARIMNLIKAAEGGEVKTTKQFLGRLNAEVTALETGKSNFALGSQERTEYDSFIADLNNLKTKMSGMPENTDMRGIISDVKANMQDMSSSYMEAMERQAQQMEEGATDYGYPAIQKKHGLLKKQYSSVFGQWGRPNGMMGGMIPPTAGPSQTQDPFIQKAQSMSPDAANKRIQELKAKAGK